MSVNYGWINLLREANSKFDLFNGVDLDGDGHVNPNETADLNNDNQVTEEEARQYCINNQQALKNKVSLIRAAIDSGFNLSNPIHNTIVREYCAMANGAKFETISEAYKNLKQIRLEYLRTLENHRSENGVVTAAPDELMNWLADAMQEAGARFEKSGSQLFVRDAANKMFDCDTAARVVLGIAYEFGFPMNAVTAPNHIFTRWQLEDGKYINFEIQPGAIEVYDTHFISNSQYIDWLNISQISIDKGAYLHNLTPEQFEFLDVYNIYHTILGQFFTTNGLGGEYEDPGKKTLLDIKNVEKDMIDIEVINICINEFNAILESNPNMADAYLLLANAYTIKGYMEENSYFYTKAIECLSRTIELDPSKTWAVINRAILNNELGNHQALLDDLDILISTAPTPMLYEWRAAILIKFGYLEAAEKDLNRAQVLAQNENQPDTSQNSTFGNDIESSSPFSEDPVHIYDMIEDGTMSFVEKSEAYMLFGDYEKTKVTLLQGLEQNPNDVDILSGLAEVELRMGRWSRVIEYANQAIETGEASDKPYLLRAEAYIELAQENIESGRSSEAQNELYQKSIADLESLFSPTTESLALAGTAHAALGHAEEARQALVEALEMNPDNVDALTQLALLEIRHGDLVNRETGDFARAYDSAFRALALDPNNPDALLACAHVGYYEDALRYSEFLLNDNTRQEEANAIHAHAAIKLAEKTLEAADSDEDYVMAFNYYLKAIMDLSFLYARTHDQEIALQVQGIMTKVGQLNAPLTTQAA